MSLAQVETELAQGLLALAFVIVNSIDLYVSTTPQLKTYSFALLRGEQRTSGVRRKDGKHQRAHTYGIS